MTTPTDPVTPAPSAPSEPHACVQDARRHFFVSQPPMKEGMAPMECACGYVVATLVNAAVVAKYGTTQIHADSPEQLFFVPAGEEDQEAMDLTQYLA